MYDKTEKLLNSTIQHGKENDRIYLMKLAHSDYPDVIGSMEELAKVNNYSKIFAKVPIEFIDEFINSEFIKEAHIPLYYKGKSDLVFMSKFLSSKRKTISPNQKVIIDNFIELSKTKKTKESDLILNPNFVIRTLNENDTQKLAELYKIVFETYPFPIHEKEFLIQAMNDNVLFFGVFNKNNQLIAASSAELDKKNLNAEMTDFAALPEYRGNNLALILLNIMEKKLIEMKYPTAYTIARAVSPGMNFTFAKLGYTFTGTLINNTNISGNIESMNIWYKQL